MHFINLYNIIFLIAVSNNNLDTNINKSIYVYKRYYKMYLYNS